jgi:membrane-bound acyltransferase YfiQ involved in biofilm formation
VGRFASGRSGQAALFVFVVLPQLILRPLFPVYRDWADFALWLAYFVIGLLAMADRELLAAILARRRTYLWLLPVVAVAFLPLVALGTPFELEQAPGFSPTGLAYVTWRTGLGFVMVMMLVGFASTFLTARPRGLQWAARMALPFYVLHHPVVVVVAALVVGMGIGMWAKFGLIVSVSLVITVLLCVAISRRPTAAAHNLASGTPAPELQA